MKNTMMNRKTFLVIIFAICISIANACTRQSDNNQSGTEDSNSSDIARDNGEDGNGKTQGSYATGRDVKITEQVLLSKDGIVITAKSLDTEGFFGPSIKILIENQGNKNVTIQAQDSSINGVMVENMLSSDVAPGKSANDEITFLQSDLDMAGIETIKEIEFKIKFLDTESYETLFISEPITVTTSADPAFQQTFDDSGFVALDKNDIKIVIGKLDSEDSFWGADIYVYIENNSDTDVIIQAEDVSINGFMADPIFSSNVLAGKKAFDTITFLESDLEDNNITEITEMELTFIVIDASSWDHILESDKVTVTFNE